MPEIATIKGQDFECVIWTKDVCASQQRLQQTMASRNKETPTSTILFDPAIALAGSEEELASMKCGRAVFFENKQYDIEFVFDGSLKGSFSQNSPRVIHRLRNVEEAFHYSARSNAIRATINTGNDIGWFRIELQYPVNGQWISQAISFEVLPVKMDMDADVALMNEVIDAEYPLWRFSLAEKTSQKFAAAKKPYRHFLLLWLAQFESLRTDLEKGLRHIVSAPHNRLVSVESLLKAEKLKGKLSPKLELELKQAQCDGLVNKRFHIKKKKLSIDTPENRFIKSVIKNSSSRLNAVIRLAKENQRVPDVQRLSDSFFTQLESWQGSLKKFQYHAMFHEVGEFKGFSRESLVLQQKPGYAKVYRVWQELKWYLDLFGNDSSLSLRNIAELYEIWCFLEIRRILLDLGFEELPNKKPQLANTGLGVSMKDGFAGAFQFKRGDGIRLRLAHEPLFRENSRPIKTWITSQKPDILLEAKFDDNKEFIWLFDAKYRIRPDDESDLVPDDAINQLHRYRDALIYQHNYSGQNAGKSRPILGAYALYPGYYDQAETENPYQEAMNEIGIGAFSLLPAPGNTGNHWLRMFLEDMLGSKKDYYIPAKNEKYFVEEAVRIPYKGTSVAYYSDLTIAASGLGPDRNSVYRKRFECGEANLYHMRLLATDRQNIEQHVVREARYLAIAVNAASLVSKIKYIYPILKVEKIKRSELTEGQTGTRNVTNPNEIYWIFTLGSALKLKSPVTKTFKESFEIKITGAEEISKMAAWDDLPDRYQKLMT